ncbi:MAG: hypothetical protein ACJ746_00885 [Bryobacteraceae bacterium]
MRVERGRTIWSGPGVQQNDRNPEDSQSSNPTHTIQVEVMRPLTGCPVLSRQVAPGL